MSLVKGSRRLVQTAAAASTISDAVAASGESGRNVLIVDDQTSFAAHLGGAFQTLGFQMKLSASLDEALQISRTARPWLIVSELRIDGKWAFDFADILRRQRSDALFVIATVYPSVATAVHAMRHGFAGYFAKPVGAAAILELLAQSPNGGAFSDDAATNWPSLDRTIWEYLNQVMIASGSMSEAARRLHIHRRSLRRMLAKLPPGR